MQKLRRSTASAYRRRRRLSTEQWIEQRIVLNEEHEGRRGPYDLSNRPWWRYLLKVVDDPNTRHIRLRCSTQVGKTLFLCAVICCLAETKPATAMVVLPDQVEANAFRDRLYALAESSGIEIPAFYKWNMRYCDLGDMRIYLAWPRSVQRLRGKRCRYVFRSEIDVFPDTAKTGDPIAASDRRVKSFKRYLIFDESTPIPEVSRIDAMEKDSNQARWSCRCPHCRTYQVPRFYTHKDGPLKGRCGVAGYRDANGKAKSPDQARRDAYYACESGCKITNEEKPAFLRDGVIVLEGQSVDKKGRVTGKPARDNRIVGLHLWAAHSHDSWGDIAAEFCEAARDGTLPDFSQNALGMRHRHHGRMPEWRELGTRLAFWHVRGTVPNDVWFLTAGGDVQDREVYVSVRGWGDHRTSFGIDWFVFDRVSEDEGALVKSDLAQIAEVLERNFPIVGPDGKRATNPRGKSVLRVAMMGIDANHRTLDVHNLIKSLGTKRIIAVRGEAGIKPADKYKPSTVFESKREDADGDKTVYEGGLDLLNINPEVFRTDLEDRFQSSAGTPGAWYVPKDAIETGKFYLQQVVNEPCIFVKGKDGRPKQQRKERDTTIGHDFWDCEVYSSAIAQKIVDDFPGRPGWNASAWPKPDEQPKQPSRPQQPHVARDFS